MKSLRQCQWIQTFAMRKDPSFYLMLANLYPAPSNETVNEALNILKSEKVIYPNDENEKLSLMEVKNILEPELLKLGFTKAKKQSKNDNLCWKGNPKFCLPLCEISVIDWNSRRKAFRAQIKPLMSCLTF